MKNRHIRVTSRGIGVLIVAILGSLLARDREAYTYLPQSVRGFITAGKMASIMMEAGLEDVTYRKLALGAVAIHVGKKQG